MSLSHYLAILTMLSISGSATAQKDSDSLLALDYPQLKENIKTSSGKETVWKYLSAWIVKAKEEQDHQQEFQAYRNCIYESAGHQKVVYADSMLFAAEKTDCNETIGSAYLTRGIVYYSRKNHDEALKNHILASRFIATTDAQYLRYKTKYNMGLIKYYLGYYNEALTLFQETTAYYKEKQHRPYINSLHNLALCYNQLSQQDSTLYYTELALKLATRNSYHAIVPHLELLGAIHLHKKSQYHASIAGLKTVIPKLTGEDDFASLAVASYYMGRNYWDNRQRAAAIPWLEKVDRIALEKNYIRPDLRKGYELLIDYHEAQNKPEKVLYYIKRLLAIDKILESDFKYLSSVVHRQYDTYSLIQTRERIDGELKSQQDKKRTAYRIMEGLSLCFAVLLIYQVTARRRYKKRFQAMMQEKAKPLAVPVNNSRIPDINPEVRDKILTQLVEFEQQHNFTRQGIRADDLAREFGTNSKYLTRVIHYYRQKNFTEYLNGLRIDYILEQLRQHPKLRQYTHTALAEEAGFSTAQHFTRAFGAKVKMPPSFYIQQLNKIEDKKHC